MSTDKFFCVSGNENYNDIQSDGKDVKRINIIRNEHPNCAIFKKSVSTIDEELLRTTLYTPDKRISKDISKNTGEIRSQYVSSEAHLETLLVYLKDIEAKLNDTEILSSMEEGGEAIYVGEISRTPYTSMLESWMSADDFPSLSKTKAFASCIYQMKKILRAQLECAQEAAEKYSIKYFTFGDIMRPMEAEKFEKHFYKYYSQAGKEYEGLNMLIKIDRPLSDYAGILDRKYIKGVILTSN